VLKPERLATYKKNQRRKCGVAYLDARVCVYSRNLVLDAPRTGSIGIMALAGWSPPHLRRVSRCGGDRAPLPWHSEDVGSDQRAVPTMWH